LQGQPLKLLSDGNLPISDLAWLDWGAERPGHASSPLLLLAIHPPNHLVLWNAWTGAKLWKTSYDESLLGVDLDPFASCCRLLLRCQNSILLVDDVTPDRSPPGSASCKRFYMLGGKSGSPGRGGTPGPGGGATTPAEHVSVTATGKAKSTRGAKLTKIMRQMVLGENRHGGVAGGGNGGGMAAAAAAGQAECISAKFHRGVKDQVLLAFPKEVLLVDLVLGQTVGSVSLERAHSPLAALLPAAGREVFFILHESGSVSVWSRKSELSVLATPGITRSQSMLGERRDVGWSEDLGRLLEKFS
jgi:hypothetical protein